MIQDANDINEQKQSITTDKGIDVFYGMLISPIKTLEMLSNQPPAELFSLLGPILIVALSSLTEGTTGINSSSITPLSIAFHMLGSLVARAFFWFMLVLFLILLSGLLKQQTSIRSCYEVTGWAFVPLIFKGIATCLSNVTEFGDILSWCLAIWFLLLQLFAFDAVLKLGRFKTLGVILILPPCLFFAYFVSMIFAGVMIADGFF